MHIFIAITGKLRHTENLINCLMSSQRITIGNKTRICKIVKARAGTKTAQLVAEITYDNIRFLQNGRMVNIKQIMRQTHEHKYQ